MSSSPAMIFHLEMRDQSAFRPGTALAGFKVEMVLSPDPALNRNFYASVGASWDWTDRLRWSEEDWERYVSRSALKTYVGRWNGETVGYFELEMQESGNVEIVYFGLLPEYIGKGLGGPFLSAAIKYAWNFPATERVWVHTCTSDHKNALRNYEARGFRVFKTERASDESD